MAATPVRTWQKDPNAVLDYSMSWRRWLAGDTISSINVSVESGDVNIDSTTFGASVITAFISAGTVDTDSMVRFRITTTGGRTDDRSIKLQVRAR